VGFTNNKWQKKGEKPMLIPDITITGIQIVNRFHGTRTFFEAKKRSVHTIGYQISGSYDHTFPNHKLMIKEDSFIFLNANEPYKVKTNEAGISISFHFTCEEENLPSSFILDCKNEPSIKTMFEKAYHDWNKADDLRRCRTFSNLYSIITKINHLHERKYMSVDQRKRIKEITQYINENLDKPISVVQLAETLDISERRLRAIFQQELHISPLDYIISQRMNTACQYLKTRAYSIADIAELCGFKDTYYFSKCFKQHIGVSPKCYQDNIYITER